MKEVIQNEIVLSDYILGATKVSLRSLRIVKETGLALLQGLSQSRFQRLCGSQTEGKNLLMDWLVGLGVFSLVVVILALIGAIVILRWLINAINRDLDHLEFLDYEDEM